MNCGDCSECIHEDEFGIESPCNNCVNVDISNDYCMFEDKQDEDLE